jgi:hypothetical protein
VGGIILSVEYIIDERGRPGFLERGHPGGISRRMGLLCQLQPVDHGQDVLATGCPSLKLFVAGCSTEGMHSIHMAHRLVASSAECICCVPTGTKALQLKWLVE